MNGISLLSLLEPLRLTDRSHTSRGINRRDEGRRFGVILYAPHAAVGRPLLTSPPEPEYESHEKEDADDNADDRAGYSAATHSLSSGSPSLRGDC